MNLKKYTSLNNSFNKEYIFHIGSEAGLYSEINNMIFAILFCLKYEYKFKLYSKDANFGFKNGWEDYFLPFCDETTFKWHHYFNKRTIEPVFAKNQTLQKIFYKSYRKVNRKTSLTFDLWNKFLSHKFNDDLFSIPDLGIKGNLNHACNKIIKIIYQFNPELNSEIEIYKHWIKLPKDYVAFQIRRGDKNLEKEYVPFEKYFDYLEKMPGVKNLFILADDYTSIIEVKEKYPQYNIFTLSDPNDKGYIHSDFIKLSKENKKDKIIRLLTSIEIMREASTILGVFAANTELFLGMAVPKNMVWLDGHEWCILHKKTEGLTSEMMNFIESK